MIFKHLVYHSEQVSMMMIDRKFYYSLKQGALYDHNSDEYDNDDDDDDDW